MKRCYKFVKNFCPSLTQPYMGHKGYSTKENVNNIKIVHLHWGLQLIFDESQKEGNNEIWIDLYPLTRFLAKHTKAVKVEETKEWVRTVDITIFLMYLMTQNYCREHNISTEDFLKMDEKYAISGDI